jgi:hypothetical protein
MRIRKGVGLIGDIDTLIAATALAHKLNLVIVDTDFKRVPNLSFELVNLKTAKIPPGHEPQLSIIQHYRQHKPTKMPIRSYFFIPRPLYIHGILLLKKPYIK